jgi:hypothetical protein
MSDIVAAVTRAANVDAFHSWSAWRMRQTSKIFSNRDSGSLPKSV